MKTIHRSLVIGCSLLALSACGPEDIASPGTGGNITINYPPAPAPSPTPSPTPTSSLVTAASGCPTISDPQGLTDSGTISGPTGTWRVCTLPAKLNVSSTLTKIAGLLYRMNGRVDVGTDGGRLADNSDGKSDTNVTLTIEPGVILYGGTGVSWLAVNRGNKISAVGSANSPIVFTSRDNVLGLNTDSSQAQWGGVVLLGRGRVTDCNYGAVNADLALHTCERDTEGAADPAIFGGIDDAYNAGKMQYVQIRYSGYVIGSDKELQSLTTEGVGSATTLDHIMSFNSSDDGSEHFGGVVNLKNYIAIGADDDSLDVDTGARMQVQFAILAQRGGGSGDAIFEIDSDGNTDNVPRTDLKVSNFTAIQQKVGNSDTAAALFRGNSDVVLMNGILTTPDNEPCLRLNGASVTADFHSVVLRCGTTKYVDTGGLAAGTTAAAFGTGSDGNNDAFTPTLTNLFVNGSNETGVAVFNANGLSSFFSTVTYIGAVKDAADTWFAGWTCNSATANFGTANSGLCTSLPVT